MLLLELDSRRNLEVRLALCEGTYPQLLLAFHQATYPEEAEGCKVVLEVVKCSVDWNC